MGYLKPCIKASEVHIFIRSFWGDLLSPSHVPEMQGRDIKMTNTWSQSPHSPQDGPASR